MPAVSALPASIHNSWRRRDDHRLPLLRAQPRRMHQDVRHRAGCRRPHRRHRRPDGAGTGHLELLGDRNWWLPGWLDRLLPYLRVEGHEVTDNETACPEALVPAGRVPAGIGASS